MFVINIIDDMVMLDLGSEGVTQEVSHSLVLKTISQKTFWNQGLIGKIDRPEPGDPVLRGGGLHDRVGLQQFSTTMALKQGLSYV